MELIACNQLSRSKEHMAFSRRGSPVVVCRCPLINGRTSFRVRGAGLVTQRRPAIPALMGFPGHPPVPDHSATTVSTLCCFGQLLRCLESTVVGAEGGSQAYACLTTDTLRSRLGGLPRSICGPFRVLHAMTRPGQVSGNRQGPTMNQPSSPWKSNFRCKPCNHPPWPAGLAADTDSVDRCTGGQPCAAMRSLKEGRRRRRRCTYFSM